MTRLCRTLHILEDKGIVEREVHRTPGRPSFAFRLATSRCITHRDCGQRES
jgi:DNA-binding HxlR family transcriptional regulator